MEITEKNARQHIDKMARKYLGKDRYPYSGPGEVRVLYKIQPEHITSMNPSEEPALFMANCVPISYRRQKAESRRQKKR